MSQQTLSLSAIADLYKKRNPGSTIEDVQELYGYLISASALASMIFAPNATIAISNFCAAVGVASLNIGGLLSWLPDRFKFSSAGREHTAFERYELGGLVHFLCINLAVRNAIAEVLMPLVSRNYAELLPPDDLEGLVQRYRESDATTVFFSLPAYQAAQREDLNKFAQSVAISLIDLQVRHEGSQPIRLISESNKEAFYQRVYVNYNAYLLSLSKERPEFNLWIDLSQKTAILFAIQASQHHLERKLETSLNGVIRLLNQLRNQHFTGESGFSDFDALYKKLFELQKGQLNQVLTQGVAADIQAHHAQILADLEKPLVDNEDIAEIVYPRAKDIYISQAFEQFTYVNSKHGRNFLTNDFWSTNSARGENIGNMLLETLADPGFFNQPLIILGNPGAGKSMLSRILAGKLTETSDYLPLLIKLREVASDTGNVGEHIGKGLSRSIGSSSTVEWLDWMRAYPERIPVIILDGFDELMQFTQGELNNYINAIKQFQQHCQDAHRVAVKIMLTSRITVMREVSIPDQTRIIKLKGFDAQRKTLWNKIWNQHQHLDNYWFKLPEEASIKELSSEPLLLFMLAVYDFETRGGLQQIAVEPGFNRSKLYDKLLEKFAIRQLNKEEGYANLNESLRLVELESFRLRLGMVGLLMFLNNTTSKDDINLPKELAAFGLVPNRLQKGNVLSGFFFIHENKSTGENDQAKLNYEFLHKSFGEFLAADFLLRVTARQRSNSMSDKLASRQTFRFCFGYNWLYRQQNVMKFLIEQAPNILKEDLAIDIIGGVIKQDLGELFNSGQGFFPLTFTLIDPMEVTTHLAIYSQNLLLLWSALSFDQSKFLFEVFDPEDKTDDVELLAYDGRSEKAEFNKNKHLWKRLCNLWTTIGGRPVTAAVGDWLTIQNRRDGLLFIRSSVRPAHLFHNAAIVKIDPYEEVLSYFDQQNFYHFTGEEFLENLTGYIEQHPEMNLLAMDALLFRLRGETLSSRQLKWLVDNVTNEQQSGKVVEFLSLSKEWISWHLRYEAFSHLASQFSVDRIIVEMLQDLENAVISPNQGIVIHTLFHIKESFVKQFQRSQSRTDLLNFLRLLNFFPSALLDSRKRPWDYHSQGLDDFFLSSLREFITDIFSIRYHKNELAILLGIARELKLLFRKLPELAEDFFIRIADIITTSNIREWRKHFILYLELLRLMPQGILFNQNDFDIAGQLREKLLQLVKHAPSWQNDPAAVTAFFKAVNHFNSGPDELFDCDPEFVADLIDRSLDVFKIRIVRERDILNNHTSLLQLFEEVANWNAGRYRLKPDTLIKILPELITRLYKNTGQYRYEPVEVLRLLAALSKAYGCRDCVFSDFVIQCVSDFHAQWEHEVALFPDLLLESLEEILKVLYYFEIDMEVIEDLVSPVFRHRVHDDRTRQMIWILAKYGFHMKQFTSYAESYFVPPLSKNEQELLQAYDRLYLNRK